MTEIEFKEAMRRNQVILYDLYVDRKKVASCQPLKCVIEIIRKMYAGDDSADDT